MEAFTRPEVSIVVPCYNEEKCVVALYQRIAKVCEDADKEYELILVDDGSLDGTWKLIEGICEADVRVIGVNLSRNFGQEASLCLASEGNGNSCGLD